MDGFSHVLLWSVGIVFQIDALQTIIEEKRHGHSFLQFLTQRHMWSTWKMGAIHKRRQKNVVMVFGFQKTHVGSIDFWRLIYSQPCLTNAVATSSTFRQCRAPSVLSGSPTTPGISVARLCSGRAKADVWSNKLASLCSYSRRRPVSYLIRTLFASSACGSFCHSGNNRHPLHTWQWPLQHHERPRHFFRQNRETLYLVL